MKDILWVSLGAIFGANLRYGITRLVGRLYPHPFPLGTLIINVTGSFILGIFFAWAREHMELDPHWRLLIAVGFCGGYTTFSSYAWDSVELWRQGSPGLFALNFLGNNILALLAVMAGIGLVQMMVPKA